MSIRRLVSAVLVAIIGSPIFAADLSTIDRTIVKEPVYSGQPRYCLLVFGPKATKRTWLVHDGQTLYVDRNGNGDLTDPGEKVAAKVDEQITQDTGVFEFEAGDIPEGPLLHKGLRCRTFNADHLSEARSMGTLD